MSLLTPRAAQASVGPDQLLAGPDHIASWDGILVSGQKLARGTLIGRITASGKLTLSLAAAGDGSQVPIGILLDDYDASAGDTNCGYYVKGQFNQLRVIYGTGHTAASVRDGLRGLGIILKPAVAGS